MLELFLILFVILIAVAFYLFIAFRRLKFQLQKKEKSSIVKTAVSLAYFSIILFFAFQIFSVGPENFSEQLSKNVPDLEKIANFARQNIPILAILLIAVYGTVFLIKISKKKSN